MNNVGMKNNGDRRLGVDRREFLYTVYLPERRSNKDRRRVSDHKSSQTIESRCDIEHNTTLPV